MRRSPIAFLLCLWLATAPISAQDHLGDARRLYNAGQFDEAGRAAQLALEQPATANSARVVLGRIELERYRRTPSAESLAAAREAFRTIDTVALEPRERVELMLGFGELFFLEDRFAAAADLFAPVLDATVTLGPAAHDRVLDWWATALDRHAQSRPVAERAAIYERVAERMEAELMRDPGSTPAGYWVVAAARGAGDLDAAWSRAMAAWVRAALGRDRGVNLRGDLDRLVVHAIIPERAARLSTREPAVASAGLLSEWEAFKASWTR